MKYPLLLALVGLGLAGCSSSAQQEAVPEAPVTGAPAPHQPTTAATTYQAAALPGAPSPRSVIYQGELSLTVDNFERATASIDQLLATHHAYLDTAHETRANGEHQQDMTLKVKPSEFTALVAALGQLGRIDHKDISSADVTADVLDTSKGLQAKQEAAARLQQQLAKATEPTQVRQLGEQLRQLQQDAQATQAHLQEVGSRSAWAVLRLHLTQVLPAEEPASPLPAFRPRWQAAFDWGWSGVLYLVVLATYFWPLLLVGAAGAGAVRYWRLRHPASVSSTSSL